MKKIHSKDKIIETLYSELKRKDQLIANLKQDNLILIKTALKATEKQKRTQEMFTK